MDGGDAAEREAERADPAASAAASRRAVGVAGPPRLSWSELLGDDAARPLPRLLTLGTTAGPGLLEPASLAASLRARFGGAASSAAADAAARFELAGAASAATCGAALARDPLAAADGTPGASADDTCADGTAGAGGAAGAAGVVLLDDGEAVSVVARFVRFAGDVAAESPAGRLPVATGLRAGADAGAGARASARSEALWVGVEVCGGKSGQAGSRDGASDSSRLKRLAIRTRPALCADSQSVRLSS